MHPSVSMSDVSVVIVTYEGAPWIEQCLTSLCVDGRWPHVIVIDNHSTDNTRAIIGESFPHVQLVSLDHNLGFGRGNNIGIRLALERGSRYVFLLNQDAYVVSGAIAGLTEFLDRNPSYGACSPLHCSPDPLHIDTKTFRGYLQRYAEAYLSDAVYGRVAESYEVHGLNAAAWLVRADVFREVGGFDPLYFMYGEDDDLLARWAFHGVSFALVPGYKIVHMRQSPVAPAPSALKHLWRKSERERSKLLGAIKQPQFSVMHSLSVLIAEGVIVPISEFLTRREPMILLASFIAAIRTLVRIRTVLRHRAITAVRGAHFL